MQRFSIYVGLLRTMAAVQTFLLWVLYIRMHACLGPAYVAVQTIAPLCFFYTEHQCCCLHVWSYIKTVAQ